MCPIFLDSEELFSAGVCDRIDLESRQLCASTVIARLRTLALNVSLSFAIQPSFNALP